MNAPQVLYVLLIGLTGVEMVSANRRWALELLAASPDGAIICDAATMDG